MIIDGTTRHVMAYVVRDEIMVNKKLNLVIYVNFEMKNKIVQI